VGPDTPLVSAIKVRYYFSDDSDAGVTDTTIAAAQLMIPGATPIDLLRNGGCGTVTTIHVPPKSSTLDIECMLATPLTAGAVIAFTVHFNSTAQNATDDYSFLDTGGMFLANMHIVVLVNSAVVLGIPAP
jgi:hypothetical protein